MRLKIRNKKAAMEMSVGTIVTIVLLMGVLVLGIFLIQKIFRTGTSAIDEVDRAIQSEINKLFASEGKPLVIYPTSREIIIKKGDDPKGFAFSVKNEDGLNSHTFTYTVSAQDITRCGTLTKAQADSFLLGGTGSFSLGPGAQLTNAMMVKFIIPKTALSCPIVYALDIKSDGVPYEGTTVFVTIK